MGLSWLHPQPQLLGLWGEQSRLCQCCVPGCKLGCERRAAGSGLVACQLWDLRQVTSPLSAFSSSLSGNKLPTLQGSLNMELQQLMYEQHTLGFGVCRKLIGVLTFCCLSEVGRTLVAWILPCVGG